MSIVKLDIYAVRNIHKQTIFPGPGINFFYGDNASGKSAILEAIFILGRAKSFRSASIKSVINISQQQLIVSGKKLLPDGNPVLIGIKLDKQNVEIRINQFSDQKRSDLAYALPLQIIHPNSCEIIEAGPQLRREFLDWGVFHDNENFLSSWRNYKRVLTQRNFLLKEKSSAHISVWNQELVYYGTIVNEYRNHYLQKLIPVFKDITGKFLDIADININYFAGWDTSKDLDRILKDDLEKDLRYGFTHCGPHRCDLQIMVGDKLVKDFVSRGQLKLITISLMLAQLQLLVKERKIMSCFLVDDFSAELDATNRQRLLRYFIETNCQVFITATEKTEFGDLSEIKNYKMFHVEQGAVKQV